MEASNDALLCPITLELFRDPVVAQDGHTYERKAIEEWIRKNGTSPITNQKISLENLVPNYAIKKMIDHFENSIRDKNYQYTLDVDVKKKKGRPLFQTSGKTIYHVEWLPTNNGRPDVVLLKIDGARANKEASFYGDLSRHPHIVRTFGLVREDDNDRNSIMLLQEYASEGSLYELLCERKQPLDEKILIEIFLQIIDAMSYLSLNNVVHGDLACRNVLVFRFDEKDPGNIVVKVTDFGLSRHSKIYIQVATVARTVLNTVPVRYSAPEILLTGVKADDYTEKSDVYAMGVLMCEAYSRGAVPWTNIQNDDDIIRRVRNGDVLPQPANCSPQYWDIITKTWGKLPNQRPTFDQLKKLFKDQLYQTTMSASKPRFPEYYQQYNQSSSRLFNPTGSKDNAKVSEEIDQMDLTFKRITFEKQKCFVRGRITCGTEELYALESDKLLTAYDGRCPICRKTHVVFDRPNQGYYVSVKHIHEKVYADKSADERSRGPKDIDKLPIVKGNLPPLNHPVLGKKIGIEGDSNSCYMDSTIFCMFAYSDVFDSLLHKNVQKTKSIENLQKLLKQNIVNVLRKEPGLVERDALFHLRALLSEATGDKSFKEMEKDPSEFLRALEDLFQYAPLKTIAPDQPPNENESNVTTNIIWEMFDANPHNLPSTNIASIFRNSLSEVPARLATTPPFLVLVAPRHARSQRSYRYIVPDRQITLNDDVVQLVCLKCRKTNHGSEHKNNFFSCIDCSLNESTLSKLSTNASVACYCFNCIKAAHHESNGLFNHNIKQMKNIATLNLFAVLCIETSQYVAFVKCLKSKQEHEWIFFDSMSDRVHEKNIPCVSRVPDFDRWIDQAEKDGYFFEDLDRRRNQGKPTSQVFNEDQMRQLRLFRDGAFFFYENSAADYQ